MARSPLFIVDGASTMYPSKYECVVEILVLISLVAPMVYLFDNFTGCLKIEIKKKNLSLEIFKGKEGLGIDGLWI